MVAFCLYLATFTCSPCGLAPYASSTGERNPLKIKPNKPSKATSLNLLKPSFARHYYKYRPIRLAVL
ncbi:hypothetical protein HMPREF1991_01949 [Hoylesella loescheii DSM 19665 = JCM 12249 = ATCC 15930]|uniref:Uncharacterized protein n=1 Tax=Hoylesella loescheii DSM 19665 = JCM 12249 = ATCC 15930 TaxID=1122985 RepID=A0A069QH14_HOYLO|nr:hypothetical protein HMPREF1991_01949 [Hoylesella loescheii DSM 19665 = JCM 12249 = ATCC 15930]